MKKLLIFNLKIWLLPIILVAAMAACNSSTNPSSPEDPSMPPDTTTSPPSDTTTPPDTTTNPPESTITPPDSTSPSPSSLDTVITNGMNLTEINGVLEAATTGDSIGVEAGTYLIDGKLSLKQGITLIGKDPKSKPIFDDRTASNSNLSTPGLQIMTYNSEISGVTVQNIAFYNIGFKIRPKTLGEFNIDNVAFKSCIFDHGERAPEPYNSAKEKKGPGYMRFINIDGLVIDHCTFLRRENNSGRGIQDLHNKNVKITNNSIGGDDPTTTGYFVTGINDRGNGILIKNNVIRKTKNLTQKKFVDHGIYAVDFKGLTIQHNIISGWPPHQAGGAIKARNGKDLSILNNTLNTSGILLYTYEIPEGNDTQQYLNDVTIKNNKITIAGNINLNDPDIYHGIGYYCNYRSQTAQRNIRIESTTITNGYMKLNGNNINPSRFSADGGGVFDNTAEAYFLKSGIDQSGNTGDVHLVN